MVASAASSWPPSSRATSSSFTGDFRRRATASSRCCCATVPFWPAARQPRRPSANPSRLPSRSTPTFHAAPQGVYWSTSPVDGTTRVVGYRALATAPALVLVGLAQQSVFQPWREHAAVVSVTAAILLALIGILIVLVQKSRRRDRDRTGAAQPRAAARGARAHRRRHRA